VHGAAAVPSRQPLAQDRFAPAPQPAAPSASSSSMNRGLLREPPAPPVDPRLTVRQPRPEPPAVGGASDPSDIPAFLRRRDEGGFIR
jgi:hypothetical protein